jgi:ABC-type lipoprotein release transport system permease subunit
MGHERALLARWTRRDWLAIAVIALTTTFLVGTTVTLLATSAQIEGEIQSLDGLEAVEVHGAGEEPHGAMDLPVATAATANDTNVTVIGVPDRRITLTGSFDEATLSAPPPDGVVERESGSASTVHLAGRSGSVTATVQPASNRSVLPPRWYVTSQSTVRELGRTGTFELRSNDSANATHIPERGTLLLGTPSFLVGGGRELLQLLGLVALGSGLLIGVTVYSVTRMTVRDRRQALFVVRSTGGTRSRLVGLFGLRAGLLTAVGAGFGYAFGVILVNAILNVATYYGTLTTIDISGSPTDWIVIGGVVGLLWFIGTAAGALSVVGTAYAPPATLMGVGTTAIEGSSRVADRLRDALGLEVVGVRTIVPMATALTVLVAIAVVSVSVGVTLAPLAGATDGVVMSPDASYPLQSQVDKNLVESFRAADIPASPEVLLPQVKDGQPYMLRGVNYSAYANVSETRLHAGHRPTRVDQAVIGDGLARTLGVEVGDRIIVGGGTAFGIDHVTVVGRFSAPGYLDDQLLISLPAAQQLANLDPGAVQIIRTTGVEEPPPPDDNGTATQTPPEDDESTPTPADIVVTDVAAPETATPNTSIPIEVTLRNRGERSGSIDLSLPRNGTTRETTIAVNASRERTVTLPISFSRPGNYTVTIGEIYSDIRIDPVPADVVVTNVTVPDTGVVNRSVPVEVTLGNRGGRPGNHTLSLSWNGTTRNTTVTVDAGNTRRVTLPASFGAPGTYTVTVAGVDSQIRIDEPAPADIVVTNVTVPDTGVVNRSVPVEVTLTNQGDQPGTLNLNVPDNGTARNTTVALEGRETRQVTLPAVFGTPGTYNITVAGTDYSIQIVESEPGDIVVTNVSAPETAVVNTSIMVDVTLLNQGDQPGARNLTVPYNGTSRTVSVGVGANQQRTVTLAVSYRSPGQYTLRIGEVQSQIRVLPSPADIVIDDVTVPESGLVTAGVPINVTLTNQGGRSNMITISIPDSGAERTAAVRVDATQSRTVTLNATFDAPGRYEVRVGDFVSEIHVVDPADLRVSPLPGRAPPNATVVATVRTRTGTSVRGVGFRIGNRSVRTAGDGTARVPLPATSGRYTLESRVAGHVVHNRSLQVSADAGRPFLVELRATPETVRLPTDREVTVTATAYNPWGEALSQELVLRREGETVATNGVELSSGENASVSTAVVPITAAGSQRVTALIDGERVATTEYTIEASDRLIALLAQLGLYESGSSLVRSLETLIGNFQVLQVTLVVLSVLMGVGSTATVVIQAVHARRRTLGVQQATGAPPHQVVRTILGDGLRLGPVASVVGLVATYASLTLLVEVGYTVIFGVRIAPLVNVWLIAGLLVGSILLVGVSSLLAAWWILRVDPGDLLTESSRRTPEEGATPPGSGVDR